MATSSIVRRTAYFFRRFPKLLAIAHIFWRFFQPKYSVGAVGVVLNDEGKVLLVEHVFHPKHPWGLPGGWAGRNEAPSTTVSRELLEELSLNVEVGPILLAETPYKNHIDLAYLCHATNTVGKLSYELLGYGWFDLTQMPPIMDVHYRAIQQAIVIEQTRTIKNELGIQ